MKRFILLTLLIGQILVAPVFSVNKAIFIHGFDSGNESWTNKNTPDNLYNPPDPELHSQVIAGYELVGYDIGVFAAMNYHPTMILDVVSDNIKSMIEGTDGLHDWIIIAHSMGGIFARETANKVTTDNLKGIITLATPHQGANASDVTHNNASYYVNEFQVSTLAGPEAGTHILATIQNLFTNWNALMIGLYVTDFIPVAVNEGYEYIDKAQPPKLPLYDADYYIGPNGTWPRYLNEQSPLTISHRSIMGAERENTLVRFLSEFEDVLPPGNWPEPVLIEYLGDIKEWYSDNYWQWDNSSNLSWFPCKVWGDCDNYNAKIAKRDAWEEGLATWNNLDGMWSNILGDGEWRYYTNTIWHQGYLDCSGGGGGVESIRDGSFDFEAMLGLPVGCVMVPDWTEYVNVQVYIGTKNDGLIQPNMTRWEATDDWTPADPESMYPQGNYYYSDTEDNGGWNHSEIMRYTRVYSGDNGLPAGDVQTPLKRNADWMRLRFEN
ncbi:MAG: hypothetical protein H8E26_00400 [FCB group bacterium]|nr:hypothetical protein [FCB group bacterium]MBL7123260.1 hypothetical protein [Candidatus Neomarinimicrobiota bacterium]